MSGTSRSRVARLCEVSANGLALESFHLGRGWRAVLAVVILMRGTCAAAEVNGAKGINANEFYNLTSTQQGERIVAFQRLGVEWVRFDFDWSVIQPKSPYDFQWLRYDTAVRALRDAHIKVLGIIDYSPAWANGRKTTKFYPPIKTGDFASFSARLAARYGPMGVHSWEIWNEPNLGQFWGPAPDPSAYTRLLSAASRAIRKADHAAVVITGGLAQPGDSATSVRALTFLEGIYRNGGRGAFDAIGDHPYISPDMPASGDGNNWQRMYSTVTSILRIEKLYGDSKPVWITEFGAPTSGSGDIVVSESAQAAMIGQALALVRGYSWAGPLFIYNFRDWCQYGSSSDPNCFYGLVRSNGSEKPSFESYRLAK